MDDKISCAEWLFFEGKLVLILKKTYWGFEITEGSQCASRHAYLFSPFLLSGLLPRTGICPYLGTLPLLFPSAEQLVLIDDITESADNGKGKSNIFLKDGGKIQYGNILENKPPLQAGWSAYLYVCII